MASALFRTRRSSPRAARVPSLWAPRSASCSSRPSLPSSMWSWMGRCGQVGTAKLGGDTPLLKFAFLRQKYLFVLLDIIYLLFIFTNNLAPVFVPSVLIVREKCLTGRMNLLIFQVIPTNPNVLGASLPSEMHCIMSPTSTSTSSTSQTRLYTSSAARLLMNIWKCVFGTSHVRFVAIIFGCPFFMSPGKFSYCQPEKSEIVLMRKWIGHHAHSWL